MKKLFTLTATLLVLGATSAMAQNPSSGLLMYWNGCSDVGVSAKTFACDTNAGGDYFICSVVVPFAMTQFTATSAIVDLTIDGVTLPDWWLTNTGQCRSSGVTVTFDPAILGTFSNCPDIWGGSSQVLSVYQVQQGTNVQGHAANTVRLNSGAAIPSGTEIPIPADGAELTICRFNISHAKTVGTGACAGCTAPACIVFNEAKIQQPLGVGDFTVVNEAAGKTRWLTYNGTPSNCPDGTPTRNRTWGAVKNLYR